MSKKNFISELLENFASLDAAVDFLKSQVAKNPVDARLNLQVFLNAIGREEEAFAVAEELMDISPKDPRVIFNFGWHLLKRQQLQEGLACLEYGRVVNTYGHPFLKSTAPLWIPRTEKSLVREHVLLVLEGGLGDEIIHARFAKNLAENHNCQVTVICQPSLASVFARIPGVAAVAQREAALGVYHNSWLPGMSAALALGLEFKDLSGKPYLSSHPDRKAHWQQRLHTDSKKIKVGLRWAGNPQFEHQQMRTFPAQMLFELAHDERFEFYSFQRDNNLEKLPAGITDLQTELTDWEETAAALDCMDLVISSCTSVAHMSAALGKRTWVVTPALPYFIWAIPGSTSPWYDSVRLFRQSQFAEWQDVGHELKKALKDFKK
jgi:hypothetical protein